jgi:hypothetical protein
MSQPVRLQLSRKDGFDLQAHSLAVNGLPVVVVSRPGRWGNPWSVQEVGSAAEAVRRFRGATCGFMSNGSFCKPQAHPLSFIGRIISDVGELRGKNLACWCKIGSPCHADVLLEMANKPVCEAVG